MLDPQHLTTLHASTAYYGDRFSVLLYYVGAVTYRTNALKRTTQILHTISSTIEAVGTTRKGCESLRMRQRLKQEERSLPATTLWEYIQRLRYTAKAVASDALSCTSLPLYPSLEAQPTSTK
jgi:hypothetical protein